MLLNQASDIDAPLDAIYQHEVLMPAINELMDIIAKVFKDSLQHLGPAIMREWYECIGYSALNKLDGFNREAFKTMLMRKHVAYGDTGLIKWGHFGMFMRLGSKVDRFLNLTKHPERGAGSDESINDTLTDIVGYCVLGITMLNRGYTK